jgi:class 3 adenylate cyclase
MQHFFRRKPAIAAEIEKLAQYDVDAATRGRLGDWLTQAPAHEVLRANPRLIADRLQLDEPTTLRLLVAALAVGLVTLRWEIQCPACANVDGAACSLVDVRTQHTCPMCGNVHAVDADALVRVTFSIDERLRPLDATADVAAFRDQIDAQHGVVSGHRLLTLQTFRDLFPNQTLPPNESMLIRRVAILFTDLAGSTALYARRGDPRAFELVRQHFDILVTTVDQHGGAVVKTIGDAVMAAFTLPLAAMEAALAMHGAMNAFNQRLGLPAPDALMLKIGVHSGPCISVTLNGRTDYFGTTVNTAARIQDTSLPCGIAFSDALVTDPEVTALLASFPTQSSDRLLKGIDMPIAVYQLIVAQ